MTAQCGTDAGYQAHRKRGEEACEPCKAATLEYHQNWNAQHPGKREEYRARYDIQDTLRERALERLAREYPERFLEIFYEEEGRLSSPR